MIAQFEQGTLPKQLEWNQYINKLREKTTPTTKQEVKNALIQAVSKRIPNNHFGLFLSGGVDSSTLALIIKKITNNFTCYSVGIKGSHDIDAARETAEALNLCWKHKTYTLYDVENLIKKTARLVNKDVVSIGVGTVVLAASELARQDNVNVFFGGLGSEELFAGYQRHANAKDVNEECWAGLHTTWQRDLQRDFALSKRLGISVFVPFLDENLIIAAMGISGDKKINSEHKKIILREIAEELGLPHKIAWRAKKAAQYGSGFDKAIEKLAKEKKMSKNEYVKNL